MATKLNLQPVEDRGLTIAVVLVRWRWRKFRRLANRLRWLGEVIWVGDHGGVLERRLVVTVWARVQTLTIFG